MTVLKNWSNIYIKNNLNIKNNVTTPTINIYGYINGIESIKVYNLCKIDKNLNLNKTTKWLFDENPILLLKNNNNIFTVNNNLLSYYTSNISGNLNTKFMNFNISTEITNIKFNQDISINKLYSDINEFKFSNKNYDKSKGYIEAYNSKNKIIFCKQCKTTNSVTSNLNINYLEVFNNCISTKNTEIKNTHSIVVDGYTNIRGNLDIANNMNIKGGLFKFNNKNSQLILPNNIYEYNLTGSLRFNNIKNTIEGYYNKRWKSISHLYSSDYKTSILTCEEDDINNPNDIIFTQNNNLVLHLNNTSHVINIYKSNTNINSNLNIFNTALFNKNLNINDSLNCSNLYINNILQIPSNSYSSGNNGLLRYNNKYNSIQLYNSLKNGWNSINFNNNTNGIIIDYFNTMELYVNKTTKFIHNSNKCFFYSNVNIYNNININSSLNVNNNTSVSNIIFNNKSKLTYNSNDNKLYTFISSNYNNYDYNKFIYLDVNDNSHNIKFSSIPYISDIFFNTLQLNNYTYSTIYSLDKNFIPNCYNSFIYHSSNNINCIINSIEFNNIDNKNNIQDPIPLNNIKNLYKILIYSNNILIYDSNWNIDQFLLKKNSFYTIQIKKIINNDNKYILFRLKGFYYSELLFNNNQLDFIYNINNILKNDIIFSNNVNTYKNTIFNNLNINTFYINNLNINSKNNTNNIININDKNNIPCFTINNNTLFIGNISHSQLQNNHTIYIKNKFNNDTLYIKGDSLIKKNLYILNNCNIHNNCIISNLFYNNFTYNINTIDINYKNNNINLYHNLNINYLNTYNLNLNTNNLLKYTNINNIIINNNIYTLNTLTQLYDNITIESEKINFKNTLSFNIKGNLSIHSTDCFNAFTIGKKINPNLSICHNGDTNINCQNNGFYLNNINILDELNNLD